MHARREPWQFFATLTFKGSEPSRRHRLCMLFAWVRKIARAFQLPCTGIFWLAREEFGEVGGRVHFHVLLSGLPPTACNPGTNHMMRAFWAQVHGGHARVYVYSAGLSAVDYIVKGLEDGGTGKQTAGAVAYEVAKYGALESANSEMLIPARALLRKWQRRLEPNRRHRKAREMKSHHRDRSHRGPGVKTWEPARFPHPAELAGRTYV